MPIIPIIFIGGVLIVFYTGANILLTITMAMIGLASAFTLASLGYKMMTNTKNGCDLFSTKKCN